HKLSNIARALVSIDSVNLPAIIGLAEIENLSVLNDLISKTRLSEGKYQAILDEGSDPRGIDVGLIFRKDIIKYIGHHSFPSAQSFKTRSVLYVRLADAKKDTFHIFVNHWKSRSGGATETEPQRIENARTLKQLTDSVLAVNPKANIVIMGDLNDEPANKSISEVLGAG
ncbi:MAG: endonuclease, partial [Bacteroidetes bacterium]|nr:endonuclease [Bacteroidota bacterium]